MAYVATLHRIVSFGWQEYTIDELDKIDSFEDTQETCLVEVVGGTPESAVDAFFEALAVPSTEHGTGRWVDKKITWETDEGYGSYAQPVTRYAVLFLTNDDSFWCPDYDAPELWAAFGARLNGGTPAEASA